MRCVRTPLLLLALLPAAARAQAARPAPRSAVLVGIAGHGTFWIGADATGRVRVLGRSDDLVVRRDSAFWRISVVDADVAEDTSAATPEGDDPPLPLAAPAEPAGEPGDEPGDEPAGEPVEAECESEPCEEPGDWFTAAIVAAPLEADDPPAVLRLPRRWLDELRDDEGAWSLGITFAGGDWLAWTKYYETTGPVMNAWDDAVMLPIDSIAARPFMLGDGRELSPFALDAAGEARRRRECAAQYVRSDSRPVDDAGLFDWPERSTFVQRLSGRWRIVERFSIGSGTQRGFVFDCVLSDRVPASLVGHDALTPPWTEIRRQLPAATDAVASPSGDLVVVLTDEALRVHAPRNGRLGAPLLVLPLHFPRIVMAHWAAGDDVARWSRELAEHLDEGKRTPAP